MTVSPPCDTAFVTTQLRLLSGELPEATAGPTSRPRPKRSSVAARPASPALIRLNTRTRQIGQIGVSEARRRLAEIRATADRAHDLVQAS